ncbi:hypothetical protein [Rubripirellula reticaptiva]|uniref:Uncharacterized protein n=1 Tax=Rubripirellula reticaptiva TaxID=2528013 RepID=A0A5C6EPW5_9BACT|nr:hypothetical protein [Rubripirellula reticaptiva]TWU49636.1 hypothetical protein Poly59_42580 [Rubripirellula reticaptiva]
MNYQALAWIYSIATLLGFVFTLGVVVFIVSKVKDQSAAKTYAITGFGMQLFITVLTAISPIMMGQMLTAESMAMGIGWMNLGAAILSMIATCFIVAAIVVGRGAPAAHEPITADLARPETGNPYQP